MVAGYGLRVLRMRAPAGLCGARPHIIPDWEKDMKFSDLIKEVQHAGLTIERIIVSSDGSISVEFAPHSRASTMAVSTISRKRVGRPPKNGRRRRRGRPRKAETA